MSDIQVFNYESNEIRTVEHDGDVWFVAQDVCDVLELTDTSKTCNRLDEDEKLVRKLFVSGQNRDVLLINESGLYALILRSNKPKVIFAEAVDASNDSILVGNLAKILRQNGVNIGQNRLFAWLRDTTKVTGKGQVYFVNLFLSKKPE